MKIKYVSEINHPHVRKRDGEEVTHVLHVPLTTDEALTISAMFDRHRAMKQPSLSLISTVLNHMSQVGANYETLTQDMAEWRTRRKLADSLANADYSRALSYLKAPKNAPKKKEEVPIVVKPVRRVYVPEPSRR